MASVLADTVSTAGAAASAMRSDTLISVMHMDNETGLIQR